MTQSKWRTTARRWLVFGCAAVMALGMLLPAPAVADISRSCTGTLWINARDGNRVTEEFTIPVTVANRLYANQARRRSRDAIIDCVQEHWAMRSSDNRPHWCNQGGNYPFQGFNEDMTDAICAANPGRQSFFVSITLWVHGNDGCESNRVANDWGYYDIADNHPVYCWIQPQPEVRQGWNLPRQDYDWWEMLPDKVWQDCRDRCNVASRCQAWTYKHPAGGEPPLCFLKDGVPNWRQDNRFVSGIKGEVLH